MKSSGQALRGRGPGSGGQGTYSLRCLGLHPASLGVLGVNTLPCAEASNLTFKEKTPVLIKQALFHSSWRCSGSWAQLLCPAGVGRTEAGQGLWGVDQSR